MFLLYLRHDAPFFRSNGSQLKEIFFFSQQMFLLLQWIQLGNGRSWLCGLTASVDSLLALFLHLFFLHLEFPGSHSLFRSLLDKELLPSLLKLFNLGFAGLSQWLLLPRMRGRHGPNDVFSPFLLQVCNVSLYLISFSVATFLQEVLVHGVELSLPQRPICMSVARNWLLPSRVRLSVDCSISSAGLPVAVSFLMTVEHWWWSCDKNYSTIIFIPLYHFDWESIEQGYPPIFNP